MHTTFQEDTMTATPHAYKELAHRANDGVEVGLFWQTDADRLVLVVDDSRSGDLFELEVSSTEALDAFEHPYAYAAHRGVEYAAGIRIPVHA
jgi:hypothetical protein